MGITLCLQWPPRLSPRRFPGADTNVGQPGRTQLERMRTLGPFTSPSWSQRSWGTVPHERWHHEGLVKGPGVRMRSSRVRPCWPTFVSAPGNLRGDRRGGRCGCRVIPISGAATGGFWAWPREPPGHVQGPMNVRGPMNVHGATNVHAPPNVRGLGATNVHGPPNVRGLMNAGFVGT